MSNIILPPGMALPKGIQYKDMPDDNDTPEEKGTMLPEPTGYKLLCVLPDASKKLTGTELDLERPDTYVRQDEHATTVLFVLKAGPDAYKDATKFPSGPWAKPGDFIITRTYSGTRLKIYGKEFRLINDDQVEAVVDDPRGITRA